MINAIIKEFYPWSNGFWLVLLLLMVWSYSVYHLTVKKNIEIASGLIGTVWLITLLRANVNILNDLYMLGTAENGMPENYYHLSFAFSLCNPIFQGAVLSLLFMIIAVLTKKNIKIISTECIWGIIAGLAAVIVGFITMMLLTCDVTYFTVLSYR